MKNITKKEMQVIIEATEAAQSILINKLPERDFAVKIMEIFYDPENQDEYICYSGAINSEHKDE